MYQIFQQFQKNIYNPITAACDTFSSTTITILKFACLNSTHSTINLRNVDLLRHTDVTSPQSQSTSKGQLVLTVSPIAFRFSDAKFRCTGNCPQEDPRNRPVPPPSISDLDTRPAPRGRWGLAAGPLRNARRPPLPAGATPRGAPTHRRGIDPPQDEAGRPGCTGTSSSRNRARRRTGNCE